MSGTDKIVTVNLKPGTGPSITETDRRTGTAETKSLEQARVAATEKRVRALKAESREASMSETNSEKVVNVTVKKQSGAEATVTEDGKTGKAEGKDAAEAISGAKDKAKG